MTSLKTWLALNPFLDGRFQDADFFVLTYDLQANMVLTIQWDTLSDYEDGQDQLQRLHSLRDRVFVVSPRLRATLEIVGTLEALEAADI